MQCNFHKSFFQLFAIFALVFFASSLQAQSRLYWDFNDSAPGSGVNPGGVGFAWSSSPSFWSSSSTGTAASQPWINGRTAVIAAGSDGIGTFGLQANMGSGVEVAGIEVINFDLRLSNNTLNLVGIPTIFRVDSGRTLTFRSTQMSWPSIGFIFKTGAGDLIYETGSGAVNTPSNTDFTIADGQVRLQSAQLNWLGGFNSSFVRVEAGATLFIENDEQLSDRSELQLIPGTLDLSQSTETIRGLSGAGSIIGGGQLRLVQPSGSSFEFSGSMNDGAIPLSLSVTGIGRQSLVGSFSYSGPTEVESGGTLRLEGGLPNSALSLSSSQLVLAAGSNSVASLEWTAGSTLAFTLSASATVMDSSTLAVTELLSGAGPVLNITLQDDSMISFSAASYPLITYVNGMSSAADYVLEAGDLLAGREFALRVEDNTLWLDVAALDAVFDDRFEGDI